MSLPKPAVALDGGCSAIYQNSLYAYQSNAFQSLELVDGAKWKSLPNGAATNKSKCVVGSGDGQDLLFIVGGTTNSGTQNFSGLQSYNFATKKWDTDNLVTPEFQNRQMHGAAYLNSTNSILVYAGYQDGLLQNSSQTFTVSTNKPYALQAFNSAAPPGVNPIVLPWNSSHAVMAGGSPNNQQVWTFSEADGWAEVNVVLPNSLPDMTNVQASLIQGDNSSKVLELFDLTKSPNVVTPLLVQPADGQKLKTAQASVLPRLSNASAGKDVDLSKLPKYNSTLAPTAVRKGFSLAQTPSGLVVITGGDGGDDPISIFNQTGNSWIDAQKFFDPSSTSSPTSAVLGSATVSPSSTSSVEASPGITSSNDPNASGTSNTRIILGSVLGGLFGLAAIVIILLLLIRRYRQKKRPSQQDGFRADTKPHQMDIDDSAAATRSGPSPADSMDTFGSDPLKRYNVSKEMISNPQIQDQRTSPDRHLTALPSAFTNVDPSQPSGLAPVGSRAPRDEGWSAYFAEHNRPGNDSNRATEGATQDYSDSRLTTYTEQSDYTNGSHQDESTEIPPLNIRASQIPPQRGYDNDNETFSGPNSSEQSSWDPIGTSERSTWDQRPPSSIYADSLSHPSHPSYPSYPGDQTLLSRFPTVPVSNRQSSVSPLGSEEDRGMRTMTSRDFGAPTRAAVNANAVAGIRRVPGSIEARPSGNASRSRAAKEDDMSWLNLGAGTR